MIQSIEFEFEYKAVRNEFLNNPQNNPKCELMIPSKSEVGRIGKMYISNIISTLAGKIGSTI